MPTVAAIGAVVSAGAAVAGQVSASKARKKQQRALEGLGDLGGYSPEEIWGSKPEFDFEEYETLESKDKGYAGIVGRILAGNQGNLPAAAGLSSGINREISASTRQRIEGWDPSFMGAMSTLQKTRNQTLKGRLPYEDALAITADRNRLANDLGNAGGAGGQVAADLGLKRLDLMTNVGPGLTASIVNILNGVDPVTRHTTPKDFLIEPREAVPWAIADNQFGAQFNMTGQLTESYLDAAPDPAAQGMLNFKAFQAGFAGGVPGTGAQTAAVIGQAFQSMGNINWAGMYSGRNSSAQIYSTPPNANGTSGQAFYTGYGGNAYAIPKATPA